jgi:tetratricopeptide (TPR) repeat protein
VSEWDNKKAPADRNNVIEEREAEKYKVKGNSLMASRDYAEALDAYTKAIQLNPAGSQSHVYFSNRAAALCYLERYEDAAHDSMKSIALNPTYGKAHARLGLSRFFLQDYKAAVAAYTKALEYDPDNAASKSYLAKAQAKLDEQQRR